LGELIPPNVYNGYYQAACANGDTYACYAQHIAANDNPDGHAATMWLLLHLKQHASETHQCIDESAILNQIRTDLAKDNANYLPDSESNARFPQVTDIANLHWDEFAKFGLPPSTFGGTPFGKTVGPIYSSRWCPN
jgi:hypothetical protein